MNNDRHKIYRENNREILREKSKDYYLNHKDEKKEKNRIYYEENKETIHEKAKIKTTCECGCIINKNDLSRHKTTTKHEKHMNVECGCGCKMLWKDWLTTKKHTFYKIAKDQSPI